MASLVGYFDDSRYAYEDASLGSICVIAGYVARHEIWEREFTPRWSSALATAPHPISEFKTSDCRQRTGEFAGWARAECDDLTRALVDIIADHCPPKSLHGVAAVVELPDVVGQESHAFFNAFWMATVIATAVAAHHSSAGDEMKFVFDRQPGMEGRMQSELQEALDWAARLSQKRRLDPVPLRTAPEFADSRTVIPLQAADLLAYETYKELKGRHRPHSRQASRALERLVEGQLHFALCMDPICMFVNQRVEALGWDADFEAPAPLFMSGVPLRAEWLYPNARLALRFLHRLQYDHEDTARDAARGWSHAAPSVEHLVLRDPDGKFRVSRDRNAVGSSEVTTVFQGGREIR